MIRESEGPPRMMISENDEVLELEWRNPFPHDHVIWYTENCNTYNGVSFIKTDLNRSKNLYLWNPTTGEIKRIPRPPFLDLPRPSETKLITMCGFGGDPDTTDFKVFFAFTIAIDTSDPFDEDNFASCLSYLQSSYELYTLSTNTWTLLDLVLPVECNSHTHEHGFYCNGGLHWACLDGKNENEDCILRFDFRNNQFTAIDLPSRFRISSSNFAEINDSLAIVKKSTIHPPYTNLDIWTLEQDTCCWTKKYIFEPVRLWHTYHFWKDGPELLASHGRDIYSRYLVSYHPDGHIVRHFEQVTFHDRNGVDNPVLKLVGTVAVKKVVVIKYFFLIPFRVVVSDFHQHIL
ncbi:unnamed protein product [Lupinus luteus]|uniref:F-box associated beta-propeller type 3 domain-containing protein n=1 Tax=Lupinus luteus TaxID=3873 RepID=A0AAV1YA44_LUPLU